MCVCVCVVYHMCTGHKHVMSVTQTNVNGPICVDVFQSLTFVALFFLYLLLVVFSTIKSATKGSTETAVSPAAAAELKLMLPTTLLHSVEREGEEE